MNHPSHPPDGRAQTAPSPDEAIGRDGSREASGSALADLIELEQRLAVDLATASTEAERILLAARTEARAIVERDGGSLQADLARLKASIDGDCQATIERIEEDAHREEERFLLVDDATALGLARFVAEQLVGGGEPS